MNEYMKSTLFSALNGSAQFQCVCCMECVCLCECPCLHTAHNCNVPLPPPHTHIQFLSLKLGDQHRLQQHAYELHPPTCGYSFHIPYGSHFNLKHQWPYTYFKAKISIFPIFQLCCLFIIVKLPKWPVIWFLPLLNQRVCAIGTMLWRATDRCI